MTVRIRKKGTKTVQNHLKDRSVDIGTVLSPQDDVDAGQHQFHLRRREFADALREEGLVERDDLRHVRHRILGEVG